jgi:eukaryotic-like serine/threonine-protein kinase
MGIISAKNSSDNCMPAKLLNNRYLIEDLDRDQLGKGAFGYTYLAKDNLYRTEQKVVVKHLQPDYKRCKSAEQKEQLSEIAHKFFQREAQVLKKLGRVSNQIPSLLDDFVENDEFYIVQEWIDGEPLSKVFAPGHCLNQKETIQLLMEILEPLDFCHQEGAIHRDLKPANLMRRHGDGKLVIIDFGAVREIGQLMTANEPQQPGSIIGTPGYASPEQASGSPVLASDVYAVGAIGMQALTGLRPHQIKLGGDGLPKWQEKTKCQITAEFANLLNQMLAVLPNARFVDAVTALHALQALPIHVPETAPAPSKPKNPHQSQFQGQHSQEIFSFETAQLEKVQRQIVEVVEKPKWLGLWSRKEHQTKTIEDWQIQPSHQKAERFVEDLGNSLQLEMVYVPSGSFQMGSPSNEGPEGEKPQHLVKVNGFYLGRYVVTQEQYLTISGNNPASWPGSNLPIENVSWHDAQQFCQLLSDRTGKKYRLPSEAEWEYACRANSTKPYYYGATITTEVANFDGSSTNVGKGEYHKKTTPVDLFPANGFGLHDMHGNVWEWCADCWRKNYVEAPTDGSSRNNWQYNEDDGRIVRGGSWHFNAKYCRSATRFRREASDRCNFVGFRVACD